MININRYYPSDEQLINTKRELIAEIDPATVLSCSDIDIFLYNIEGELDYDGMSATKLYLCHIGGIRFLVKFCAYRLTEPELYGSASKDKLPETDAEIKILYKLRDNLTYKHYTPCIVEILYSRVCDSIKKLAPGPRICTQYSVGKRATVGDDDKLKSFLCDAKWKVDSGLYRDKCAFIILDRCDISFERFLMLSHDSPVEIAVFKSVIFQIIHAFYAITQIYPGFWHGDLHSYNVQIKFNDWQLFDITCPEYRLFIIEGHNYYVPYFGLTPKIIDFGFSSIPEENITSYATDNVTLMNNRASNDLLFLFHRIYLISVAQSKIYLQEILKLLEPNQTYIDFNVERIRNIAHKIPSYRDMIKRRFLSYEYERKTPPGRIISTHGPIPSKNK